MAWNVAGSIRGPQGPQGVPGSTGPAGETGPAGAQGPVGADGAQGVPGVSLDIEDTVANYAGLPGGLGAGDTNKAWLVAADGQLYIWDGDSFPTNGSGVPFVGPQGPTGPQGIQGEVGETGQTGSAGSTGATGVRGSLWYTGAGVPSGISGAQANDLYLDTQDGSVYVFS